MTNPLPSIGLTSSRFSANQTTAEAAYGRAEPVVAAHASSSREPRRQRVNPQESRLRSASPRRRNVISGNWTRLLNNLDTFTRALAKKMARDGAYAGRNDVEHNATNVRCPSKDMVTIDDPWRDSAIPIHRNLHATTLHFTPSTPGDDSHMYIAAQSPIPEKGAVDGFFACEKFLAKALESGLGIFQFVSPSKTGEAGYISKRSIIGQLTEKINQPGGKDLLIGRRYTLKNFGPLETTYSDGSVEHSDKHYALEVEDTKGVGNPHPRVRIILTQAQVAFDNKVVAATDIRQASELMDELHKQAGPEHKCTMVVSHAGIGRNATLIAYREMYDRIENGPINNPEELEAALEKLIMEGRAARGPQFVHSEEQVRELASTLKEDLERKTQLKDSDVGRQSRSAASEPVNPSVSHWITPVDEARPATAPTALAASKEVVAAALENLFQLQDTPGDGNCLFHALEGDLHNGFCQLPYDEVVAVRNKVADVRKNEPDNTPKRLEYNCSQIIHELDRSKQTWFEIPEDKMVSNERYADFQRRPGVYAGDDEIAQWPKVKGNEGVTVIVVDAVAENPYIKTYPSEGKTSVEKIDLLGTTPDQIREQVIARLENCFDPEFDPKGLSPVKYRVILRQGSHFQRIVGLRNDKEREHTDSQLKKQKKENEAIDRDVQETLIKRGGVWTDEAIASAQAEVAARRAKQPGFINSVKSWISKKIG
ncbi:hypothetical protein QN362_03225 [Actimicrobium sp. CCC2.4]|uniref:hypothetical protein n=1 Tax=Actimicrobium sp. CCC2.4 TaxID=3048606 RepID=UPI002AC9AA82|nr:hypothetical protein [Actimicrobium sp. CCC2.4]MEB0134336.1 hypothetical protein [Actimicrobium sp. CCC2.4]WPX32978.1 hypothetical protein RHM62_03790 [Actimicrobium sp. CCC2.4]